MQIIDACTLCNFSVVGRMGLLRKHYGDEARWTQAIQWETARLSVPPADTAWLGPALDADDIEYTVQVHTYRRMLGARPRDRSTLHLGEAEGLGSPRNDPRWPRRQAASRSLARLPAALGSPLMRPADDAMTSSCSHRSAIMTT